MRLVVVRQRSHCDRRILVEDPCILVFCSKWRDHGKKTQGYEVGARGWSRRWRDRSSGKSCRVRGEGCSIWCEDGVTWGYGGYEAYRVSGENRDEGRQAREKIRK